MLWQRLSSRAVYLMMIIEFQGGKVFQKGRNYRNSERFLYIDSSINSLHSMKRRERVIPQEKR